MNMLTRTKTARGPVDPWTKDDVGPLDQPDDSYDAADPGRDQTIFGQVKWFDPGKGFGFILPDAGGPDILLHANVLRNFGQGSVVDGSLICIRVLDTDRGLQATEVLSITPPASAAPLPLRDMEDYSAEDIANIPVLPVRVKWFDKTKGFGFANVFGSDEDVFIHIEVLRQSGLSNLDSGEAVGLRIVSGQRGRMAIEVVSWDAATK